MADERAIRDANRTTVILGITDDSDLETKMIRVDPTTLRLKTTGTISSSVLPTGAATETTLASIGKTLVSEVHDYIALGYTGSNLTSVVYKTGGAAGATVATLALAYTGSVLDSVTKT